MKYFLIGLLVISSQAFALEVEINLDAKSQKIMKKIKLSNFYTSTIKRIGCWDYNYFNVWTPDSPKILKVTKSYKSGSKKIPNTLRRCNSYLSGLTISAKQSGKGDSDFPAAKNIEEISIDISEDGMLDPEYNLKCKYFDRYTENSTDLYRPDGRRDLRAQLVCDTDISLNLHPDSSKLLINIETE